MKVWGVVRDGEGWSGVFCSGEATGGRWVRPRERKKEKNGSTCMLIEKYENELSAEIGEVGGGRWEREKRFLLQYVHIFVSVLSIY